jgi:hypothetical protein
MKISFSKRYPFGIKSDFFKSGSYVIFSVSSKMESESYITEKHYLSIGFFTINLSWKKPLFESPYA